MKIQELRIGNYVQSETTLFSETKWRQWQIMPDDMKVIIDHPDNYSPISLTEQRLKDFGFKKSKLNIFWDKSPLIVYFDDAIGHIHYAPMGYYEETLKVSAKIIYVHEIQNLYHSLTGKELIRK